MPVAAMSTSGKKRLFSHFSKQVGDLAAPLGGPVLALVEDALVELCEDLLALPLRERPGGFQLGGVGQEHFREDGREPAPVEKPVSTKKP